MTVRTYFADKRIDTFVRFRPWPVLTTVKIHYVGGGERPALVHAHVQSRFALKTESPLGRLQLPPRDAQGK